ncbi:hypothetical protein [Viridibacterium curvum]|uniref:Uncharacterized protein n=1 Tax=Viridibacterium curvum TaxID=1101404 RepID=A0ABP9QBV2_9RHOO
MSIWMLIGGLLLQGMLGYMLFMVVVFWGGGLANGRSLALWQIRVLDLFMFIVPGASFALGVVLVVRYALDLPAFSGWWHLLPLMLFLIFAVYAARLPRR